MTDRKIVLITGCTRGCGRALAGWFREQGWTVAGCGRNAGQVRELQETFGRPHAFCAVDVAVDDEVSTWIGNVVNGVGTPDLVINNAALINPDKHLWEMPAGEFDPVIDVNIKGTVNVIRHIVPAMIGKGSGVIANISSGWGRSVSPRVAPYCATKWAIEGLTRALAEELPPGLAAVAVNPGIIDTDMLRSCWADEAGAFPGPEAWVQQAGPFFARLTPAANGSSLSVPG